MHSTSSTSDSTTILVENQHRLASRCRKHLMRQLDAVHFLAHPWSGQASGSMAVKPVSGPTTSSNPKGSLSPVANHLLHIFAPLIRDGFTLGNRAVDRSEPLAVGMEHVLRTIHQHSHSFQSHQKTILLHALLPLYLAISDKSQTCAFSETMVLCREYLVLGHLDHELDNDLAAWVAQCQQSGPIHEQMESLHVHLPKIAQHVWESSPHELRLPSQEAVLCLKPQDAVRRRAQWQIARQWLSDSPHITIPKELAIERTAWQNLREHFATLVRLLSGPHPSAQEIATSALEMIESCQDQVESALTREGDQESRQVPVVMIGTQHPTNPTTPSDFHQKFSKRTTPSQEADSQAFQPIQDSRVVEIRSSSDPKLTLNLDQQLSECRARQGSMALMVVRAINDQTQRPAGQLAIWQQAFVEGIRDNTDGDDLRGFLTPANEVAMLVEDMDRGEVTSLAREILQQAAVAHCQPHALAANAPLPLIAGIAFVSEPTRSFRIQQLIDAAWRCLDGAAAQGSGAVKSLEVF